MFIFEPWYTSLLVVHTLPHNLVSDEKKLAWCPFSLQKLLIGHIRGSLCNLNHHTGIWLN